MSGPWTAEAFETLWAEGADAWAHRELELTATIAAYWCWSKDERCAEVLIHLPLHPHHATDVAEMCMRQGRLDATTIRLLHRYSVVLRGGPSCTRDRAIRMCSSATRFLSSHAYSALQIISNATQGDRNSGTLPLRTYLGCMGPGYPLATRRLAAALVSLPVERPPPALVAASFDDLAAIAPWSDDAVDLLILTTEYWIRQGHRAMQLLDTLLERDPSAVALDLICEITDQLPDEAVDHGAALPMVNHGIALPDAVMRSARHGVAPRNEHHLLVYLVKFGCPPPSCQTLLKNVLRTFPVDARVVYVSEMHGMNRYRDAILPAAVGAFNEQLHGCTVLVSSEGTEVPVLTAHLARYCGYFNAPLGQQDRNTGIARDFTAAQIRMFKNMLYYDNMPQLIPSACGRAQLMKVAALADMLCDARHACMCVFDVALGDFWAAYDLAKEWHRAVPVLAAAARRQLPQLVRCSRLAEIVDIVV